MHNIALNRLLRRLENLYPKYIDLSLKRLSILLKKLNNPHLRLPHIIHIAGTNGKGSTLSFIKQILIEHNFKVHCYISPHLESIEERFVVSNNNITKNKLYYALKHVEKINNKEPITFFEITTATAFHLFSNSKADFLILETGLGGRLDATNIIYDSTLDIITPISYDHQEYLGKSLKKITNEKLGIIKKSSTIIIGKQENEIKKHILKKLNNHNNRKIFFGKNYKILDIKKKTFTISYKNKKSIFIKPYLLGEHQIENATLAIIASYEINKLGYRIKNNLINKALINNIWPGRLEKFYFNNLPFFLDGAHNIEGAKQLAKFLSKENKETWFIIGMLKNKNINLFLKFLKKNITGVVAIKIPGQKNSFTSKEIANACKKLNIFCVTHKNITSAKKYLLKKSSIDRIVITGSLYLIGKVRKLFI